MMKIPNPIWYIAAFLTAIIIFFLMCNPKLTSEIFGKGKIASESTDFVQLKGQLLINRKAAQGYDIKIMEYSDSDTRTLSNGKFTFRGVPNSQVQQIINIQIKCPNSDRYVDVDRKDLTNDSKFPIVKGWIDLGIVDCPKSICDIEKEEGSISDDVKSEVNSAVNKTEPPINACNYNTEVGKKYKVNSPLLYLTLSSEALSEAQAQEYIKKENNPKYKCTIKNGELVTVIDNTLPKHVKVSFLRNNKNITGFLFKCKDGYQTLQEYVD